MPPVGPHPEGFSRQVNFRITLEDWPLLEAAAREHGGIGTGIIAGLRALQRDRLEPRQPAPLPPSAPEDPEATPAPAPADAAPHRRRPRPAPTRPPDKTEKSPVWVPTSFAAGELGVSPETLRGWIRNGRGESVHGKVRLDTLRVPRAGAAKLLRIKSATLAQRPEPKPDKDGLYRVGDLERTDREIARESSMTPEEVREIFEETGRTRDDGVYIVREVNVLNLLASARAIE